MRTYQLTIPGKEIVRLVRAEFAAEGGQPELYQTAWRDYLIEEEFDRDSYGLQGRPEYSLVTQEAVLAIEPRVERNYWVLKVVVDEMFGPRVADEEQAMVGADLTLDEFEKGFLSSGHGKVTVRLETQTVEAKRHFDDWLNALRIRHPNAAHQVFSPEPAIADARRQLGTVAKMQSFQKSSSSSAREIVGTFATIEVLEAAVRELGTADFNEVSASVLASVQGLRWSISRLYCEMIDDAAAKKARMAPIGGKAGTSPDGSLFHVDGLAGTYAIATVGGALAAAIAGVIANGKLGIRPADLVMHAVAGGYGGQIEADLARDGLVLWVRVADQSAEERTRALFVRRHASHVHAYVSSFRTELHDEYHKHGLERSL